MYVYEDGNQRKQRCNNVACQEFYPITFHRQRFLRSIIIETAERTNAKFYKRRLVPLLFSATCDTYYSFLQRYASLVSMKRRMYVKNFTTMWDQEEYLHLNREIANPAILGFFMCVLGLERMLDLLCSFCSVYVSCGRNADRNRGFHRESLVRHIFSRVAWTPSKRRRGLRRLELSWKRMFFSRQWQWKERKRERGRKRTSDRLRPAVTRYAAGDFTLACK